MGDCHLTAVIIFLTLPIPFLSAFLQKNRLICPLEAFVDLTMEMEENVSQTITVNGTMYPPEAIQFREERFYGCPCLTRMCIPFCCPLGNLITPRSCVPWSSETSASLPPVYDTENFTMLNSSLNENEYFAFVSDPCRKHGDNKTRTRTRLFPEYYDEDIYLLLSNGSLFLPYGNYSFNIDDYCFGLVEKTEYIVIGCQEELGSTLGTNLSDEEKIPIIYGVGLMVSIVSFFATYIVYSVLPDLQNTHGSLLRIYLIHLFVSYVCLVISYCMTFDEYDIGCTFLGKLHFCFIVSSKQFFCSIR